MMMMMMMIIVIVAIIIIININIDWTLESNCIALGHWAIVIYLVVEFRRTSMAFGLNQKKRYVARIVPFRMCFSVAFLS